MACGGKTGSDWNQTRKGGCSYSSASPGTGLLGDPKEQSSRTRDGRPIEEGSNGGVEAVPMHRGMITKMKRAERERLATRSDKYRMHTPRRSHRLLLQLPRLRMYGSRRSRSLPLLSMVSSYERERLPRGSSRKHRRVERDIERQSARTRGVEARSG